MSLLAKGVAVLGRGGQQAAGLHLIHQLERGGDVVALSGGDAKRHKHRQRVDDEVDFGARARPWSASPARPGSW